MAKLVELTGKLPEDLFQGFIDSHSVFGISETRGMLFEMTPQALAKHHLLQLPPSPEEFMCSVELRQAINDALSTLAPRERKVIEEVTMNGVTLEELGAELGLHKEHIRRIEAKALRKLRYPARSIKLKPFL